MTKKQWQQYHGFTDEDMALIEMVMKMYNGKITKIVDKCPLICNNSLIQKGDL